MMRCWKVLCVTLRCRRTGLVRDYFIETRAFWPYAEWKARKLALADGLVDPEHRGGEWVNNPWNGKDKRT